MTIPDDVMKQGREVADECLSASGLGDTDKYAAVIARAIMAERERCAKVAETHGRIVSNEAVGKACSRNIAEAIRKGEA